MSTKKAIVAISVILLFIALLGWNAQAQRKSSADKITWEYKYDINYSIDTINALGAERWELVGYSWDGANKHFYFKRAK